MSKVRAGNDRLWTVGAALIFALLLSTGNAAEAASDNCRDFNLASKPDAEDLGLKLVGFASAGIVLVTEFAEPKPLKITAAALGGTVAAYDLVAIVRKYLGSTSPVTLCPREPNRSPLLGVDRSLVEALAHDKPTYHPSLLDQNVYTKQIKLFESPLFSDTQLAGLGPLGVQRSPKPLTWHNPYSPESAPRAAAPQPLPAPSSPLLYEQSLIDPVPHFDWPPKSSPLLELDASVSGRIIDGATGGSLVDAVVKLTGPDQGLSLTRETVTAADGTYRFDAVTSGSYLLSVRYIGYSSSNRKVEVAQGEAVGDEDITLANTAYPCDYSVINETADVLFLHYDRVRDPVGVGSAIMPQSSFVLRALDRRRQISADSLSGVRWQPYWVECGGRNSVALLPPHT